MAPKIQSFISALQDSTVFIVNNQVPFDDFFEWCFHDNHCYVLAFDLSYVGPLKIFKKVSLSRIL